MDSITLELSIEEINAILALLGNQPYVQVFSLVEKIQRQAAGQMQPMHEMVESQMQMEKADA